MDIQKIRAELEELPEVKEALQLIDGFDGCKYHSINNHRTADWLNGALYAWKATQAVPEGFVLVPREPTGAMIQAGRDERRDSGTVASTYKAMIKAV